eukprot:TRINITY_DN3305_c2_g1_i1.p1 TRINITY_DN3305_c2_g1~~TRINITY_DN3305_c2_g1_i1.p1  ORF type:complete len:530 (+),score=146.22 TRINITY_DN3305_c2_g1_i1:916-2505(+)
MLDALLQYETTQKGIVSVDSLPRCSDLFDAPSDVSDFMQKISLWQGDITRLNADAIVNAANSRLLGCYQPSHKCIDNVIHASAGPALRDACHQIMQQSSEPEGCAKITPAFNLPSKHVIHTVGPNLNDSESKSNDPTDRHRHLLASCYTSCLTTASQSNLASIAFCCISTGLFGFPNLPAAKIAIREISTWISQNPTSSVKHVILNVFKSEDLQIYRQVLEELVGKPMNSQLDFKLKMSPLTPDMSRAIDWIKNSDRILVTAGAGLSASAGLDYTSSEVFKKIFPAMYERGFRCMYEFIGFKDWTPDLQWGYLLDHIHHARYNWPKSPVYADLKALVESKLDYFVYTSNADGMFEQNGFDVDKIYTVQGDYGRLQCGKPCRPDAVFSSRPIVESALPHIDNTQILTRPDLIPRCPICGEMAKMNVRGGSWFIEDHFLEQRKKFQNWISSAIQSAKSQNKLLTILEIGCGFNTPSVTRWPMEMHARNHENVRLVRINAQYPEFPEDVQDRAIGIAEDATWVMHQFVTSLQ